MQSFLTNLPHLIMAVVVIVAVSILAGLGVISGSEALIVITGAGGFSLGAAAGTTSASVAVPGPTTLLTSSGGLTATVAPTTPAASTAEPTIAAV